MKRVNLAVTDLSKSSIDLGLDKQSRYIKMPCVEKDILYLQEIFLANGFHHLKVKNIETGRLLISLFLHSLNYYHEVACLTVDNNPLDKSIFNLYRAMLKLDALNQHDLEDFLVEYFYCDFMWIEATKDLTGSSWFPMFKKVMHAFNIDKHIPIVILSYL